VSQFHWFGRGIATLGTILALGAQPVGATVPDLPDSGEPRVEMFLQAFLQMTFWPSNTYNQIAQRVPSVQKLGPVVRVRMDASGYEPFLHKLLRDEAVTAGIEVVFLDDDDRSEDVFIEIHHYTDAQSPMWKTCNTLTDVGEQGQPRVHVHADPLGVIRNLRRNTAGFYGCFNHETLHALGLNYDHDHPSVMSDAYSHWSLTPIDRMSVHTLYDQRVVRGMHWLGAMAAAREVVVERMIAEGAPPETANMGRRWVADLARRMIADADAGKVDFQTQLGFAYTYGEAGEYLPKDVAAGYRWFRRAAEAGDVEAQAQVGQSLIQGRGVAADHDEGMRWLRMAAEKGNAEAKRALDSGDNRGRTATPPPAPANDNRLRVIILPPAPGASRR
jgi:Sel1 repeat-containing protein